MTPEREKQIREWVMERLWFSQPAFELLAEIDRLREQLAVAVESLEEISEDTDYYWNGKDDPSYAAEKAKIVLLKIRGEK